ncbi:MutS-related protein [Leifsonia sp. SIMBA_070]|uniref:MutS-related protein n=1 Tax=Leifsonia sp. SIMBA_070 TaxID=3085810 RepID=UPI00397937BC
MKAHLLFKDIDFDTSIRPTRLQLQLGADLELNAIVTAMANDDAFLRNVAEAALLQPLTDPERITYRQQALTDALNCPEVLRSLYAVCVQTLAEEKKIYGWGLGSPTSSLHRSVEALEMFILHLRQLRLIADEHAAGFHSPAFTELCRMLTAELSDDYFAEIDDHLRRLRFRHGVLISARLGHANKGTELVLRRPLQQKVTLFERLGFAHPAHSMTIADRDEAGFNALSDLRNHGLSLVASALAQSTEHIKNFFTMLRTELGFYLAAINLQDALTRAGASTCIPTLTANAGFRSANLYDAALALISQDPVIGNEVDAFDRSTVVITGANRGGKSTFLRSVGQAQLLTQCGLFVPADDFETGVRDGIFTHFKREEDASMQSGKLDEELARMSSIVDQLRPGSLLLLNESFASTNEREGSEILRHLVGALTAADVRVALVTHLYDFAHRYFTEGHAEALFLRANRDQSGNRDFRLVVGPPLPTSFGEDVYDRIFDAQDSRPQTQPVN